LGCGKSGNVAVFEAEPGAGVGGADVRDREAQVRLDAVEADAHRLGSLFIREVFLVHEQDHLASAAGHAADHTVERFGDVVVAPARLEHRDGLLVEHLFGLVELDGAAVLGPRRERLQLDGREDVRVGALLGRERVPPLPEREHRVVHGVLGLLPPHESPGVTHEAIVEPSIELADLLLACVEELPLRDHR